MSTMPRLNRLFAPDGKCLDVAMDHGSFGELVHLAGIENLERTLQTIVPAAPDAIQLGPGQAPLLQHLPGKNKPALVLRTDTTNVYGEELPRHVYSQMIERAVEQAVRLDAAGVIVNLLQLPDQPELHHQCVANLCHLKAECERYAMPLMVETVVLRVSPKEGGYEPDGDTMKLLPLVRQAVELGADVIKGDPGDDVSEYHRVIEMAGRVPVLVRGGGKVDDATILKRTFEIMEQGAAGIVYGRNIIQHPNPAGITRALMAIVHDGATPERAIEMIA
jgi:DhnA family fructose-bisphosphate aldolase class Ia